MKKVPSLTSTGWLTEIRERADQLMAYYLASEASQTRFYEGKITSLPAHIQRYGRDSLKLRDFVEHDLSRYFQRYFDAVDIRVTTDQPDENDPEHINLQIDVIVVEDDRRYSLGRLVTVQNSKINQIFNVNNG